MTLKEYLQTMEDGYEVTVCDKYYDTETYFYNDEIEPDDDIVFICFQFHEMKNRVMELETYGYKNNIDFRCY